MPTPTPANPAAHAPISPARSAAFAILERVATTSAHSDDLLHGPGISALSQADRNLATTLVLGVLRWQIALDARLRPLLSRPDLTLPTPVATALRMGALQLQHLDRIPAHAALSESVELVRAAGHGHAAGMVNAILRKLTRQAAPKQKLHETTAAFAQRLAHPEWLVARWVRAHGRAAALAICSYDQHQPRQGTLFVPEASAPAEAAPAASARAEPARAASAPQVSPLPNIDDGSRLVAELAAAAHPHPRRIWDCCAAPGGKALILHHRLTSHLPDDADRDASPHLLTTDVNPRRLQALAARLRSAAPGVRTLEADAAHLPASEGLFDLILCDVPCSGTGTLSRNPEIRHRLQPSDIARQAARQREILSAALSRLAPGGHLVYSTCSLEPEENEEVVAAVLASLPAGNGIAVLSLDPVLNHLAETGILAEPPSANLLRSGYLRTLPGATLQGDGFFAALFHRT